MSQAPPSVTQSTVGTLRSFRDSFELALEARNRAPTTVTTYLKAFDQFADYLADAGMPTALDAIRREHIEAFLVEMQQRGAKPATVAQRYRSLQQFWRWAIEEDEIRESPMRNMDPPHVPEEPPPVVTDEEMGRLIRTCAGTAFDNRRDAALLWLLYDSGMRRAELAGIRMADLDMKQRAVTVLGKGRRPRVVPFGRKTAQAIDRYLRSRGHHKDAETEWLWLGRHGRLTDSGVFQVVRDRGNRVGLPGLHPHQFRHTYAHNMLAAGLQEGDLMMLAGWKSRTMLSRYGASAAAERARAAYRNLSPADRLNDRG